MPAIEASKNPWPTKPAKAGSWPEPPPEMMATFFFLSESGRRKMILFSGSKAREGFVRVKEWRAVTTKWFGSEKKCLAVLR